MNGILLIDKPMGWTSHDVVAKVRGMLKQASGQKVKVGHSGTLDPFASGLMILVVGSYTKKAALFSKLDKIYEAEICLGKTSTTGDPEGKITSVNDHRPSPSEIDQALNKFVGEIEQTPHAFSAIKIAGQRAYKLARAGKEVVIERRKVKIYQLKLEDYNYPLLKITVRVSSGTYIRSLAEDIGKELGTGAYLTALRRTQVGKFGIKEAQEIQDLQFTSDLLEYNPE